MSDSNGLTGKQKAFVEAYLANGFNATGAARQAGYKHPNVAGPQNLVKDSIRSVLDARLEASVLKANEVLAKEDEIARFDIAPYLIAHGGQQTAIDVRKLIDDGYGHLVRGVKHTQHGTVVELANPDDARDRLLKAYGVYRSITELTGEVEMKPPKYIKDDRSLDAD